MNIAKIKSWVKSMPQDVKDALNTPFSSITISIQDTDQHFPKQVFAVNFDNITDKDFTFPVN